jgi:low affinity Fe/Cu permease
MEPDGHRVPGEIDADDRRRWVQRRRRRLNARRHNGRLRQRLARVGLSSDPTEIPDRRHWTSRLLHRVGEVVANSSAGIVAAGLMVAWAVVGAVTGFPSWWQTILYSVTASVTFVMVFVIQHTQARQTAATQRKLDELVRASEHADNTLIAVEEAPGDVLEALTDLNLADRAGAHEPSGRPPRHITS